VDNPSVIAELIRSGEWGGVGIVPGIGAIKMPVKEFESI
jgi:hypothetical protein